MAALRLTVVTPTWNAIAHGRRDRLVECIQSVARLDVPHEHLLMDGASTDGTVQVLETAAEKDSSVRVFSEPDGGLYDAMNKGGRLARGEWIYFLGCDDALQSPEVLARAIAVGEEKGVDLIACPVVVRNSNRGDRIVPQSKGVFGEMPYPHQGVLMRTALFVRLGGFRLAYKISGDFDLMLRAHLLEIRSVVLTEPFAIYDGGGLSSDFSRTCHENSLVTADNLSLTDAERVYFVRKRVLPLRVPLKYFLSSDPVLRKASRYMLLRWVADSCHVLKADGPDERQVEEA